MKGTGVCVLAALAGCRGASDTPGPKAAAPTATAPTGIATPRTTEGCLAESGEPALRCWVELLADPALAGRQNGSKGGERARQSIVSAMRSFGLQPVAGSSYEHAIASGANVVAEIPGTDPAIAGEFVVLGAHYDHLGEIDGTVYPGADDNASGVAVVLEVARALAQDKSLGRSVLVVAFDAEEPPEYLTPEMGSQAFVDAPPVPRESIVAMVCLDLMGGDPWPGANAPLFALGGETFADPRGLDDALAIDGAAIGLSRMHLRLVEDLPTGRQAFSDYGPFRDAKIPVVFFTAGRSPHYHQPSDTPDTLRYDKLAAASTVVERTVRTLAGGARPRWRDDQPLQAIDGMVVADLALRAAAAEPGSPELAGPLRATVRSAAESLRDALPTDRAALLDEALARRAIATSLLLQCLLAPDDEIPPLLCMATR